MDPFLTHSQLAFQVSTAIGLSCHTGSPCACFPFDRGGTTNYQSSSAFTASFSSSTSLKRHLFLKRGSGATVFSTLAFKCFHLYTSAISSSKQKARRTTHEKSIASSTTLVRFAYKHVLRSRPESHSTTPVLV